ncbi:hypothetical protein B0H14DRAFT_695436 [Mycena olivaceomarginata]|nr:hypothetical protein B0H14DRAFT_695436 [Mycena olivaceomarginata]
MPRPVAPGSNAVHARCRRGAGVRNVPWAGARFQAQGETDAIHRGASSEETCPPRTRACGAESAGPGARAAIRVRLGRQVRRSIGASSAESAGRSRTAAAAGRRESVSTGARAPGRAELEAGGAARAGAMAASRSGGWPAIPPRRFLGGDVPSETRACEVTPAGPGARARRRVQRSVESTGSAVATNGRRCTSRRSGHATLAKPAGTWAQARAATQTRGRASVHTNAESEGLGGLRRRAEQRGAPAYRARGARRVR